MLGGVRNNKLRKIKYHYLFYIKLAERKILGTLSEEEDRKLREKIKPLMLLSGKRIVDLEKELKISSGGISGWLNGGIMRLSTKRKNEISLYLGLKNGYLDDDFVHIFKSEKEVVEEKINVFFDFNKSKIFLLKSMDKTVGVYIIQDGAQAIIIPKLSFEDVTSVFRFKYFGEAKIAKEDLFRIISVHKVRTGSVKLSIGEEGLINNIEDGISPNVQEVKEWFSLVLDLIKTGISPEEVRIKIGIK
jgi:hypothetical protein